MMTERKPFDRQSILEMASQYMAPCVLGAAAELDLFTRLGDRSLSAEEISGELQSDARATAMLLDAAASLGLLEKREGLYSVPPESRSYLIEGTADTMLPYIHHMMNVLRSWSQLAWVAKSGKPPQRVASIRGEEADRAAFVAAMHAISAPVADALVARLGPPEFKHLLDVGGASGTWALAFLRAVPGSRATLFDLPDAVEQARERFVRGEFADRIELVAGDFYVDDLPGGADFAWVSAIAHQHSRERNRELYAKVFAALVPGGRIAIRDIVMDSSRTQPVRGALFAINMLVNTETGGTFTFEEFAEDLQAVGFVHPELAVAAEDMNAVVVASKPAH